MALVLKNHRPMVMGRHGAVGANNPLAAQAGLDVLRKGGNAADAAVAVSLALGVCEPGMSGLGGDGFFHFHSATTRKSSIFNGSGPAPAAATAENFGTRLPAAGPLSVSVPGKLGALGQMHSDHGALSWAQLVEPAITLAREGFPATHSFCSLAQEARTVLAADRRSAAVYLDKKPSDLVVQPELARTLEEIAAEGADALYRGALARRLVSAFAEAGVLINQADLETYRPEVTEPIGVSYRGFDIRQTPPNTTGFTMLQIMKIAENFSVASSSVADWIHVLVEAKKLAFLDRDRYSSDPRFREVPVEDLLSDAYIHTLASKIDLDKAANLPIHAPPIESDTTYFCVVDAAGNAVSGIQSNASSFGSGVIAGETGILLNNRMAYWSLLPEHANRLQPGKRISHTMNAPMVFKNGELWCVFGTPGADNQVQVNAQALTAMIDRNLDPQTALEHPRWTSSQLGQGPSWRNESHGRLTIEEDYGPDILQELEKRGHVLQKVPHLGGPCAMQAIRIMPNGVRVAGSDPRRDGWAAAY
jgi:gamma-glutamyltranspeptidase